MSFEQTISISGRFPTGSELEQQFKQRMAGAMDAAGQGVVMLLKQHFLALNASRHSGYSTVGFYAQAADQTGYIREDGGGTVFVMKRGIRQRLLGGRIKPKGHPYLAIPNSFSPTISDTYGKSPVEFGNLRVLFGRQKDTGRIGPIGLVADEGGAVKQHHVKTELGFYAGGRPGKRVRYKVHPEAEPFTRKKTRSSEGEVLFWLKRYVDQRPDPSVIPSLDEMERAGYEAAKQYLQKT